MKRKKEDVNEIKKEQRSTDVSAVFMNRIFFLPVRHLGCM